MDNQELKIKFEEIKNKIETAKSLNQDVAPLLKTKYDLLKMGYSEIKSKTSDEKFDKNPKKYSVLLAYVNSMRKIADEIKLPTDEVSSLENEIKEEMDKNQLGWLLRK